MSAKPSWNFTRFKRNKNEVALRTNMEELLTKKESEYGSLRSSSDVEKWISTARNNQGFISRPKSHMPSRSFSLCTKILSEVCCLFQERWSTWKCLKMWNYLICSEWNMTSWLLEWSNQHPPNHPKCWRSALNRNKVVASVIEN